MPPLEEMDRHDTAVLWPATGLDRYGKPTIGSPVELTPEDGTGVRWVAKKKQIMSPQGQPVGVDVTVILDREVPIGSKMWKGALEDWDDEAQTDVMEVVAYEGAEDLKGRHTTHSVMLKRHGDDLPT